MQLFLYYIISGQIIVTSHNRFPSNGGLEREFPGYFREIVPLVKYCSIWPDNMYGLSHVYIYI